MANIGLAPMAPGAPVSVIRANIADVAYIPLVPVMVGYGDYPIFSDVELNSYITSAASNTNRATGLALMALSSAATADAAAVTSADIRVDITNRAADFRSNARVFFELAATEDRNADVSYFGIVTPVFI